MEELACLEDGYRQFLALSTIARCLIHGIMARSLAPTSSIGCAAFFARIALNEVWLTRFSSIQFLTNFPVEPGSVNPDELPDRLVEI